jgi:hypothetical protein
MHSAEKSAQEVKQCGYHLTAVNVEKRMLTENCVVVLVDRLWHSVNETFHRLQM